ncbi:MAG: B12-binding domain-containing protein [Planctomyces sp.]|nr:B12-binding domain-containing protein [Planctomyces sp.]
MSDFFSPKDVAIAIGVSESSLKRWVDRGLIRAEKTAGGHRRLSLDSVLNYIRGEGKSLPHPEAIGLPEGIGAQPANEEAANADFRRAMVAGDELLARRIILDVFISGMSVAKICDNIITPVFHQIGDLWRCGEIEVFQERRACETCSRVIHELRRAVGPGPQDGPIAIGGTIDGDPYTLATGMAELVLRDAGWRAMSLGNMLPFDALNRALQSDRPALMWVSVTSVRDMDRFIANFNLLFDEARAVGAALVVGGQGLTADVRQHIRYTTFCDNFRHLEAFANTIRPRKVE